MLERNRRPLQAPIGAFAERSHRPLIDVGKVLADGISGIVRPYRCGEGGIALLSAFHRGAGQTHISDVGLADAVAMQIAPLFAAQIFTLGRGGIAGEAFAFAIAIIVLVARGLELALGERN